MNTYTRIMLTMALLALCAVRADIVHFNDGGSEEGYVQEYGDRVSVYDRSRVNRVNYSTNRIKRIEYDKWIGPAPSTNREEKAFVNTSNITAAAMQSSNIFNVSKYATNMGAAGPYVGKTGKAMEKVMPNIDMGVFAPAELFTVKNIRILAWLVGLVILGITSFVMQIVVLIDAFKNSMMWGFLCLCCTPAFLIYLFTQYTGRKAVVFFWLIMPLLWTAVGKFML